MSYRNKRICRFCLQPICQSNFDFIEEVTKNMLDLLLLRLVLEISKEPVMCDECGKNLQKSFDFKLDCINTSNNSVENNNKELIDVSEDHKICQICLKAIKEDSFTVLCERKESVFIIGVLQNHMPELNLNVTEDLIICGNCHKSVQVLFNFVKNCLEVEEKIRKYVDTEQIDGASQLELHEMLQKTIINDEVKFSHSDSVEMKNEINGRFDECEENIVKDEIEIEDYVEFNEGKCSAAKCEEIVDSIEHSDIISSQDATSHQEEKMYGCEGPPTKTQHGASSKTHKITHKRSSGAATYTCKLCPYNSKYKQFLETHTLAHENISEIPIFKCETCSYLSKYKSHVKTHVLTVHRSASTKPETYGCTLCSYRTKRKDTLKSHQLVHKDSTEVVMHRCASCPYETKFKKNLKRHMICHKNESDLTMYKCQVCSFETKHRNSLKNHSLCHRDPMEVKTFQCHACSYRAKIRCRLKQHCMLRHTKLTEVQLYKCSLCSYQTKLKNKLTSHAKVHKSVLEID